MTLSFEQIPVNTRVPFAYIEFNNTNAKNGASIQPFKTLVIGQSLSAGTKDSLTFNPVTSEDQAREYFGAGSQLYTMLKAFFAQNQNTSVVAVPVDDDASGVSAVGEVLFAGTATASGVVYCYVAGKAYKISVVSTDTAAEVCAALVAEINDDVDRIVTAAVDGSVPEQMNLTARNKGEFGNEIDLRFNYYDTETTVAGITHTVTSFTGGSVNPDIADVIAVLDDTQYNVVVMPWSDTANLNLLETELASRWAANRQIEGHAFLGKRDSYANLLTYGDARNNKHETVIPCNGPSSPWDIAAQVAAEVAKQMQIDPARPVQNLVLNTVLAPSSSETFSLEERNLLLYDGISTLKVSGGKVYIERLITTYQTNGAGADDESYLRVETMFTIAYIRYDFRTDFYLKFPRHKLADDGTRFGEGQPVVTPKIAKAFCLTKFTQWEDKALVEGFQQFKDDLIVERNSTNTDRLDILLPPNLVNQMRVLGAQIQFIL